MSYCLFELARNPDVMRKVQEEIDRVFRNTDPEEVTYEMLDEIDYLDCCVNETLRLYPPIPVLNRISSNDYKIPGKDLTIPKGTSVWIPMMGLHRDPEIYENPLQFKPERFSDSPNGTKTGKGTFYMPFGDGPRICIGLRLSKIIAKLGLLMIVSKFNFELNDKTMIDEVLEFSPNQGILNPIKPFNFKISRR